MVASWRMDLLRWLCVGSVLAVECLEKESRVAVITLGDLSRCTQYRGRSDVGNMLLAGCTTGGVLGLRGALLLV